MAGTERRAAARRRRPRGSAGRRRYPDGRKASSWPSIPRAARAAAAIHPRKVLEAEAFPIPSLPHSVPDDSGRLPDARFWPRGGAGVKSGAWTIGMRSFPDTGGSRTGAQQSARVPAPAHCMLLLLLSLLVLISLLILILLLILLSLVTPLSTERVTEREIALRHQEVELESELEAEGTGRSQRRGCCKTVDGWRLFAYSGGPF